MPTFDVTIERQTTAYLIVTVEAETANEAHAHVEATLAACQGDAEALGWHGEAGWEIATAAMAIDGVEEV
jgi:hypothetical protein